MAEKKELVRKRLERAKKKLKEKVLEEHDEVTSDPVKMTGINGGGYAPDAILLSSGHVVFFHHGHRQSIRRGKKDAQVDGFNGYAPLAAEALVELGVMNSVDAQAFKDWYRKNWDKACERASLQDARDTAAMYGYTATFKKKKRRKRG